MIEIKSFRFECSAFISCKREPNNNNWIYCRFKRYMKPTSAYGMWLSMRKHIFNTYYWNKFLLHVFAIFWNSITFCWVSAFCNTKDNSKIDRAHMFSTLRRINGNFIINYYQLSFKVQKMRSNFRRCDRRCNAEFYKRNVCTYKQKCISAHN